MTGQNVDTVNNFSFITLPPIVRTCKQFLAELPPVFYKVNTFTFAVGANTRRDPHGAQEQKMLSGVLGLSARQRKAALAGDSGIRLWRVNLKIWNVVHIYDVRRNITASRKDKTTRLWQRGLWRSLFEARLEIVGSELTVRLLSNARWVDWGPGWWTRTKDA